MGRRIRRSAESHLQFLGTRRQTGTVLKREIHQICVCEFYRRGEYIGVFQRTAISGHFKCVFISVIVPCAILFTTRNTEQAVLLLGRPDMERQTVYTYENAPFGTVDTAAAGYGTDGI